MRERRVFVLLLFVTVVGVFGCTGEPPSAPGPGYVEEIESYRAQREERLRAEEG